jgi:tRNA threonylcarbamoyladenosine biosynthesis protein TsaB
MKLLAIETSTRQLGVALLDGEELLASYDLLADYPHAVELPDAVRRVLAAGRITLKQVDALAVDIGPGSFTGLRIGMAFIKALACTMRTPIVGVASLDVLAANLPFVPGLICPLLDAKQKNVYAALYQIDGATPIRRSDYFLGPLEEWLPRIQARALFLGDGCARYRDQILERLGDSAQIVSLVLWLPRAATLARLARAWLALGKPDDPAQLVPLYLYPLDCSVRGPDRPTSVLPKTPAERLSAQDVLGA